MAGEDEAGRLRGRVAELEGEVQRLEVQLADLRRTSGSAHVEVKGQEAHVAAVTREMQVQTKLARKLKAENETMKKQANLHTAELTELRRKILSQESQIARVSEAEAELQRLGEELEAVRREASAARLEAASRADEAADATSRAEDVESARVSAVERAKAAEERASQAIERVEVRGSWRPRHRAQHSFSPRDTRAIGRRLNGKRRLRRRRRCVASWKRRDRPRPAPSRAQRSWRPSCRRFGAPRRTQLQRWTG